MSIDQATLGTLTMELLDEIEGSYGDEAKLVRAMVIMEVTYPDDDDDELRHTTIQWARTDESPSGNLGLAMNVVNGLSARR